MCTPLDTARVCECHTRPSSYIIPTLASTEWFKLLLDSYVWIRESWPASETRIELTMQMMRCLLQPTSTASSSIVDIIIM